MANTTKAYDEGYAAYKAGGFIEKCNPYVYRTLEHREFIKGFDEAEIDDYSDENSVEGN